MVSTMSLAFASDRLAPHRCAEADDADHAARVAETAMRPRVESLEMQLWGHNGIAA